MSRTFYSTLYVSHDKRFLYLLLNLKQLFYWINVKYLLQKSKIYIKERQIKLSYLA